MKRIFLIIGIGCLIFGIAGCAFLRPSRRAGRQILPSYLGPKARIAIADFKVKAAKATNEIGLGLREMLINSLVNSNRFSVVKPQACEMAMKQQGLSVSGGADQSTEIEQDRMKDADLIIIATVTEFESQTSGGRAGVGGGGDVGSGVLGGLSGGALDKAHLALDICLVDASSSEILAASRIQGQASDVSGAIITGFLGGWGLSSGLSAYANTPMEKAIGICIIEAVKYIAGKIPPDYYKY